MKKLILLLGLLCIGAGTWAQKSNIRTTREFLSDNNYKKALPIIEEAVKNEETKNSPDAWYWRGMTYLQMALDSTAKSPTAVEEATSSFLKTLSLKPDFGEEINNPMYSAGILTFNRGIAHYQEKQYGLAYADFMKVNDIYNAGGGKRFLTNANFKELVVSAKTNAAYASMNDNRYGDAQTLFEDINKNQAKKDSNIYQSLIEIYQKQHKDAEMLTAIQEARKQFPNNQLFRNLELNYYISTGKQSELLPKLEDAVQKEPNNPELLFNLANAYTNVAFPKDAKGSIAPSPANFTEVYGKAENTYKKVLGLKPDNVDYNYNMGVLYYDNAAAFNRQMMDIKGNSPAENKRSNDLIAIRDVEFDKAVPYFEKVYTMLDARSASLSNEEKVTYQNAMIALREIYSRKNNKPKTDELKKKLDALR